MTDDKKKIAVIAGAGPAGLTSAYEFLHQNTDIHPIVLSSQMRLVVFQKLFATMVIV